VSDGIQFANPSELKKTGQDYPVKKMTALVVADATQAFFILSVKHEKSYE
jgi:hypothetical protein